MTEPHEETEAVSERSGPVRMLLAAIGIVLTVLGTVGAFLPVLPTTPFVLLAAACFARSSPRFHQKLRENRIFGPYIQQWESSKTIPLAAKRKAYGLVIVTFGISILLVTATWLRVTLGVVGGSLIVFLAWLPSGPESEEPPV